MSSMRTSWKRCRENRREAASSILSDCCGVFVRTEIPPRNVDGGWRAGYRIVILTGQSRFYPAPAVADKRKPTRVPTMIRRAVKPCGPAALLLFLPLLSVGAGCGKHGKAAPTGGSDVPPSKVKLERKVDL